MRLQRSTLDSGGGATIVKARAKPYHGIEESIYILTNLLRHQEIRRVMKMKPEHSIHKHH